MPVRLSGETEHAKYNTSECEILFVNEMHWGVSSCCCAEPAGGEVLVTKISRTTTLITNRPVRKCQHSDTERSARAAGTCYRPVRYNEDGVTPAIIPSLGTPVSNASNQKNKVCYY